MVKKIMLAATIITLSLPTPVNNNKYIYYYNTFYHSQQEQIQDICKKYDIDYRLVLAIGIVESELNPEAIGDNGQSYGLYQIQPRFWDYDGTSVTTQTESCCKILQKLYKEYKTTDRVLSAYNSGLPDSKAGQLYCEKVCKALRGLIEDKERED